MQECRWTYEPADFFEASISITIPTGEVIFSSGEAIFRTTDSGAIPPRQRLEAATGIVRSALDARRTLTGRPYNLSTGALVEIDEEGKRHLRLFAEAGAFGIATASVDFIVKDATGRVIADSKAERIAREAAFVRDLTAKAAQSLPLVHMLRSYAKSLDDPGNALVHLYEIRDAAAEECGGAYAAIKRLGVPKARWNRLGELANDAPLLEGRHRGQMVSSLRPATKDELAEARAIASEIISAFAATV